MNEKDDVILRVRNVSKYFGPTKALQNVSMDILAGVIHGLIGENGSGKSTLSSIVAGIQQMDSGEMLLFGEPYKPRNLIEACKNGISMLTQEQNTLDRQTVAANIFLGKEDLFSKLGVVNVSAMKRAAQKALDAVGAGHINAGAFAGECSFEDRKLIELARAMLNNPKILIIDETTNALTKFGRDILYKLMDDLRSKGKSVLFISHDVDEIMTWCDSITVLRDGIAVTQFSKNEYNIHKIRQSMIGREIDSNMYRKDYDPSCCEKVVMRADNVSAGMLKDFSMELHEGEIIGIGGLSDCGIHDVGRLLFGLLKIRSGAVYKDGKTRINSPDCAVANKIAYVSKDRDIESLMSTASVRDNIALPSLNKLSKGCFVSPKKEKEFVTRYADSLNVKMSSINQYVMYLSGGNKQKVALAKWIGNDFDVLVVDCPTRGIDIGVKVAIYDLMYRLKKDGKSIVMISEELAELIGMSDRMILLKNGEISKILERHPDNDESRVIEYII